MEVVQLQIKQAVTANTNNILSRFSWSVRWAGLIDCQYHAVLISQWKPNRDKEAVERSYKKLDGGWE